MQADADPENLRQFEYRLSIISKAKLNFKLAGSHFIENIYLFLSCFEL